MGVKRLNLSWPQFEVCNQSTQTAFERMRRLLLIQLIVGIELDFHIYLCVCFNTILYVTLFDIVCDNYIDNTFENKITKMSVIMNTGQE